MPILLTVREKEKKKFDPIFQVRNSSIRNYIPNTVSYKVKQLKLLPFRALNEKMLPLQHRSIEERTKIPHSWLYPTQLLLELLTLKSIQKLSFVTQKPVSNTHKSKFILMICCSYFGCYLLEVVRGTARSSECGQHQPRNFQQSCGHPLALCDHQPCPRARGRHGATVPRSKCLQEQAFPHTSQNPVLYFSTLAQAYHIFLPQKPVTITIYIIEL